MRGKERINYGGIAIAIFFGLIMITAVLGHIFGDNPVKTAKYNGIKFTATDKGWSARYEGQSYSFPYLPNDLENIPIPSSINFGDALEIDVTYDFNSTNKEQIAQSMFELQNILDKREIYLRQGFTTNTTFSLPIITCNLATPYVPVIYYKVSNETLITQEGNCVILASAEHSNSFLALTTKIAYKILKIM